MTWTASTAASARSALVALIGGLTEGLQACTPPHFLLTALSQRQKSEFSELFRSTPTSECTPRNPVKAAGTYPEPQGAAASTFLTHSLPFLGPSADTKYHRKSQESRARTRDPDPAAESYTSEKWMKWSPSISVCRLAPINKWRQWA